MTRLGDSVDSIALSRGTTRSRLLELNAMRPDEIVRPGTLLLLPAAEAARSAPATSSDEKPIVVVPADTPEYPGRRRVFYRVAAGDTLPEIARVFRVTPDDVRRWNALDPAARLHEGMNLQMFVETGADLSKIVHMAEGDVRCITVGSDEFFAHFEGLKNRKRTTIAVEDGDTWEKIAKRFNLTVGQLERINQRSHTDKLAPKETLVVYAPVGRAVAHQVSASSPGGPSPLGAIAAPSPDDLPPRARHALGEWFVGIHGKRRHGSALALLGQFFSYERSRSADAGRRPLNLRRGRRSCASEQNSRTASPPQLC